MFPDRSCRRSFSPHAILPGLLALALVVAPSSLAAGQPNPANPPADGFNAAGSDAQAMSIADSVMTAMGGRSDWDATRYLSWNFFGLRTHVWDKWSGDLRYQQGKNLVLMNINSRQGRAFADGVEVTDPEKKASALKGAYEAWINDSYWLLMPYKLKDSGVTLKYLGADKLEDGRAADKLQLTFAGVGVTPQNKYWVYVSQDRHLVEKWSYFKNATDPEPGFSTPWASWTKHGRVLLSGDRGQRQLTDIRVLDTVPEGLFTDPSVTPADQG